MKILLIQPPDSGESTGKEYPLGYAKHARSALPPLGLLSLAPYLSIRHEVVVRDMILSGQTVDELPQILEEVKPDIVEVGNKTTVVAPGTNGKMNELQAALGMVQLRHVDQAIARRLEIDALYRKHLASVPGIRLLPQRPDIIANGAYFPIFVNEKEYGISRDELYQKLRDNGVYARRYFYPLISSFPMYKHLSSSTPEKHPVAKLNVQQVLCLPIYAKLR